MKFKNDRQERVKLFKFPRKPADLKDFNDVISRYTQDHLGYVYLVFCYLYVL